MWHTISKCWDVRMFLFLFYFFLHPKPHNSNSLPTLSSDQSVQKRLITARIQTCPSYHTTPYTFFMLPQSLQKSQSLKNSSCTYNGKTSIRDLTITCYVSPSWFFSREIDWLFLVFLEYVDPEVFGIVVLISYSEIYSYQNS